MAERSHLILAYDANLAARQITQDTVDVFKIRTVPGGVAYPVPDCPPSYQRYKNFEKSKINGKYAWGKLGKPTNALYYHAPNLLPAIRSAGSRAWLVSGEADVWAMYSAGIRNVFSCGFTERNVVAGLPGRLKTWGVKKLYLAPDCDTVGMEWAAEIQAVLLAAGSPVEVIILALPAEIGSRYDVGRAWAEFNGPVNGFAHWLLALPPLEVVPAEETPQCNAPRLRPLDKVNPALARYRGRIAVALGVEEFAENGFSVKAVYCPFHDDQNPSASVHEAKGLYCHAEKRWYGWKRTLRQLGIGSKPKVYPLPVIPPIPPLPTLTYEIRQAMCQLDCTLTARLLDTLFANGVQAGTDLPIAEISKLAKSTKMSLNTVYRACEPIQTEMGTMIFLQKRLVSSNSLQPTGGNNENNSGKRRGRPSVYFRIPTLDELETTLRIEHTTRCYTSMTAAGVTSNRLYRAQVYSEMPRRHPGTYSRIFLAKGVGVSCSTAREYDQLAGLRVIEQQDRVEITTQNVDSLPEEPEKDFGVWLETGTGARYPQKRKLAKSLLKDGQSVELVRQMANWYGPGNVDGDNKTEVNGVQEVAQFASEASELASNSNFTPGSINDQTPKKLEDTAGLAVTRRLSNYEKLLLIMAERTAEETDRSAQDQR